MDTRTSNNKILIFAGTYEGHQLAKHFSHKGYLGEFCVATDYGRETLSDVEGVNIIEGRLKVEDMKKIMGSKEYGLVIDATHPYAQLVTDNIKNACTNTGTPYIRLLRKEEFFKNSNVISVDTIEEASIEINKTDSKVLLTTGSKELSKYSGVKDLGNRLYVRVLPSHQSLDLAEKAGIPSKHIICMQGPFTRELNLAIMNQYNCKILVTKNTGRPGGFDDKLSVAEAGYKVIVIGRPVTEYGLSYEEVVRRVDEFYE